MSCPLSLRREDEMLLGGLILSCPTRTRRRQRAQETRFGQNQYYKRCGEGDSGEGARCGLLCRWLGQSSDPSSSSSPSSSSWRYRLCRGQHAASETSLLSRWSKEGATSRDTTSRTDESVDHPLTPPIGSSLSIERPFAALPIVVQTMEPDSLPFAPPHPSPYSWVSPAVAQDVLFPIDAIEFLANVVGSRSPPLSSVVGAVGGGENDDDGASLADSKAAATPSVVSHLGMEDPIAALAPVRLWGIPSNAMDAPNAVDFDFDPRRSNLRLLCRDPAATSALETTQPSMSPSLPLPSTDHRKAAENSANTNRSTPDVRSPVSRQPPVGAKVDQAPRVELELPPLALERSPTRCLPPQRPKSIQTLKVPLYCPPSPQTPPPGSRRKVRIRVRLQGSDRNAGNAGDSGTGGTITGVDDWSQQQQRKVAESVVAELLRSCHAHHVQVEVILEASPRLTTQESDLPTATVDNDDGGVHTFGSGSVQLPRDQ